MSDKSLGQIAFEAMQREWNGWDVWDDPRQEWAGESEMDKAMWDAGAEAVARAVVSEGFVVIDRARFERLREAAELWSKDVSIHEVYEDRFALEPGDLDPLP
jgi:hypothetical protein